MLGLTDRRKHAKNADPVGDKVRGIDCAHHPFAERGREKGFELIEQIRPRGRCRDQLCQMHVARWIKKMHTTKTGLKRIAQSLRQSRDRQARGVGRKDRVRRNSGRYFFVERMLPVHALGDGLND